MLKKCHLKITYIYELILDSALASKYRLGPRTFCTKNRENRQYIFKKLFF